MVRFLPVVLFLLPLAAQTPQEAPRPGRAQQEPKNLKLLKPEEVRAAMRSFTVGLGVNCGFCHTQGDFASDENSNKVTARRMIAMARQANASFPDGKERVTCYTCHRGEAEPKSAPPAQQPAAPPQQ
jgi:Photosynthetic reaction centre cytochrome C subunit